MRCYAARFALMAFTTPLARVFTSALIPAVCLSNLVFVSIFFETKCWLKRGSSRRENNSKYLHCEIMDSIRMRFCQLLLPSYFSLPSTFDGSPFSPSVYISLPLLFLSPSFLSQRATHSKTECGKRACQSIKGSCSKREFSVGFDEKTSCRRTGRFRL